jgi:glycosyltransferase involved in cell wall biosynthesis
MQRMSAIATKTRKYVDLLEGTNTKVLDTRKTTPGFRACEKWAVKIGGGENHRFALYDMIMLKDNHNDFAGGITKAINKTKEYLKANNKDLKIIVEARSLDEIKEICEKAGVNLKVCENVSHKSLLYEYNKSDVMINFSTFEGGPQTFIEASLCKIPTLIRENNELSKLIPCFTGKNKEEFIDILSRLKSNRTECKKKGAAAYKVAIANFTYKKVAKKFADFFMQVKT